MELVINGARILEDENYVIQKETWPATKYKCCVKKVKRLESLFLVFWEFFLEELRLNLTLCVCRDIHKLL